MSIAAIDKAECSPCPHLQGSDDGCCSIYQGRPNSCREFSCGWLQGAYGPFDRPDKTGIIIVNGFNWDGDGAGPIPMVAVMESWPGAVEQERGLELLDQMSAGALVTIMFPDGKRELLCQNEDWLLRARAFAIATIEAQVASQHKETSNASQPGDDT